MNQSKAVTCYSEHGKGEGGPTSLLFSSAETWAKTISQEPHTPHHVNKDAAFPINGAEGL